MEPFGMSPMALFGLAVLAIISMTPIIVVVALRAEKRRRAMWGRVGTKHGLTPDGGSLRGVKYGQEVEVHEVVRGTTRGSGTSYTVVAATIPLEPGRVIPPEARRALAMRYPLMRFDEEGTRVHIERRSFRVDDAWLSDAVECCARAAYDLDHLRRRSAAFSPSTVVTL